MWTCEWGPDTKQSPSNPNRDGDGRTAEEFRLRNKAYDFIHVPYKENHLNSRARTPLLDSRLRL